MNKKKWIFVVAVSVILIITLIVLGIPTIEDFLLRTGIIDRHHATPPDADAYFGEKSNIIAVIDAKDSEAVMTEEAVSVVLQERGFDQYAIESEYDMNGDYYEATSISTTSAEKHPMYQTYHITDSGEIWIIYVINESIIANPVSFNFSSDLAAKVVFSENETITSYDSTTNSFYVTTPYESALIVHVVDKIDAETLEKLTIEVISDYE